MQFGTTPAHPLRASPRLRPAKCQDARSPPAHVLCGHGGGGLGAPISGRGARPGVSGSRTHSHGFGHVGLRAFPVKGTEPLAARPVNALCFSCLNVPLPMTVSGDLSERHPNVFTEEAVGPRSVRLLFRGEKGRQRTAELAVFRRRGFSNRPCRAGDRRLPELLWALQVFLLENIEEEASDRPSAGPGAVGATRRTTGFNLHTLSLVEEINIC